MTNLQTATLVIMGEFTEKFVNESSLPLLAIGFRAGESDGQLLFQYKENPEISHESVAMMLRNVADRLLQTDRTIP
jgi:hypothetical protein